METEREGKRGKEGMLVSFRLITFFMNNFNKGNKFLKVVKTKNSHKNLFRF